MAFDDKLSVRTIDGRVYIKMNLEAGQNGTLTASTVSGQILEQKTVSGQETTELKGIKSSGIYFISLSLDGIMFSKKVLIQK